MVKRFRNSRPRLAVHRLRRIRAVGNSVKRRKPHSDLQPRRIRTNARDDFPQKARPIFKAAAVFSLSRVRAEKFMPQITVAMLDVDKIESQILRAFRRSMKIRDDRFYLGILQKRVVAGDAESLIHIRMVIENPRLVFCVMIQPAVAPRMRQLAPYDPSTPSPGPAAVFSSKTPASPLAPSFPL